MSEWRRGRCLSTCGLLIAACASDAAPPGPRPQTSLSADVAARVADVPLEVSLVRDVSEERHIGPQAALSDLIHDAVLAEQLVHERPGVAAYVRHVVLARKMAEGFLEEAKSEGPPTEAEVAEYTHRHWWELDRPAAARVAHAVVLCEECDDARGAEQLAEQIAEVTAGITDAELFVETAKNVEAGAFEVVAQELQPVAADGRIVLLDARPNPDFDFGRYHEVFAAAANALESVGQQSEVVRSPSGFHVLLLLEKQAAKRVSYEERARVLSREILSARARQRQAAVVSRAREAESIEVERSFDQDTELLLEGP